MWKPRPDDNRPTLNPPQPSASQPSAPPVAPSAPAVVTQPKETPKPVVEARADVGHIGKSVVIRGELTGNEDLYLDGEIEGTINLRDHKLVIGPNGKIKATITARDLVLHGRVDGNITASERVELKRSCSLHGDVTTQRIAIEDGAYFKGSIDIKEHNKETKTEQRKPMMATSGIGGNSSSVSSSPTMSASSGAQGSFLEPK